MSGSNCWWKLLCVDIALSLSVTVDIDVFAFDGDRVSTHIAHGGEAQHPARLRVERRAVTGTDDAPPPELPFTERSVVVRAHVVDRVQLAVEVAHRQRTAVAGNHTNFTDRHVSDRAHPALRHD